eukprot:s2680_g9.t1
MARVNIVFLLAGCACMWTLSRTFVNPGSQRREVSVSAEAGYFPVGNAKQTAPYGERDPLPEGYGIRTGLSDLLKPLNAEAGVVAKEDSIPTILVMLTGIVLLFLFYLLLLLIDNQSVLLPPEDEFDEYVANFLPTVTGRIVGRDVTRCPDVKPSVPTEEQVGRYLSILTCENAEALRKADFSSTASAVFSAKGSLDTADLAAAATRHPNLGCFAKSQGTQSYAISWAEVMADLEIEVDDLDPQHVSFRELKPERRKSSVCDMSDIFGEAAMELEIMSPSNKKPENVSEDIQRAASKLILAGQVEEALQILEQAFSSVKAEEDVEIALAGVGVQILLWSFSKQEPDEEMADAEDEMEGSKDLEAPAFEEPATAPALPYVPLALLQRALESAVQSRQCQALEMEFLGPRPGQRVSSVILEQPCATEPHNQLLFLSCKEIGLDFWQKLMGLQDECLELAQGLPHSSKVRQRAEQGKREWQLRAADATLPKLSPEARWAPTSELGIKGKVACCQHFGVTADLWSSFVKVAGDPSDDFRLLAALPPSAVAAIIETVTMESGEPISIVQAAQLGYVYRLSKRKFHVDSGLDLSKWTDPDPWGADNNAAPTSTPTEVQEVTKAGDRKMKFSAVLDQGDESEFPVLAESQKQIWLQHYISVTGNLPLEHEEPSTEQLSALHRRLTLLQTPYADFALFGPFGRKTQRAQRFRTFVMTGGGQFYARELPGPNGIDQWRASFRVYRTAMLMLGALSMSAAVAYESMVERLDRVYKGCWHLITQADDLARGEHVLRLKVVTELEIARGERAPPAWNPDSPWEALFRRLLKDSEFWTEQVHTPANAWLAHGSKGRLLTPAEAIADAAVPGGSTSLKADTESPRGAEAWNKRSANARKRDAKKRKAEEMGDKDMGTKGKAKGKGKGKPQLCYAWNNNGLTPNHLAQERLWGRTHNVRDKDYGPKGILPIFVMAGSAEGEKTGAPARDRSRSGKKKSQERRRERRKGKDEAQEREPKATIGGKQVTLRMYTLKRRSKFLHLYSGREDPLGSAIKRLAKDNKMKVTVVTCEKEEGVDLLQDRPYLEYLDMAKDGSWDGMHSGFPCTSFTKLRWRKADGYPGPVRSKRHPYGIPGIPRHRQEEADEGTLHASRTVHLGEAVLRSRPDDRIRPFVTVENPPPSDHPEHLSAWELPEVKNLCERYNFTDAQFPTCRFQQHMPLGQRTYKPQMFSGNLPGSKDWRADACVEMPNMSP